MQPAFQSKSSDSPSTSFASGHLPAASAEQNAGDLTSPEANWNNTASVSQGWEYSEAGQVVPSSFQQLGADQYQGGSERDQQADRLSQYTPSYADSTADIDLASQSDLLAAIAAGQVGATGDLAYDPDTVDSYSNLFGLDQLPWASNSVATSTSQQPFSAPAHSQQFSLLHSGPSAHDLQSSLQQSEQATSAVSPIVSPLLNNASPSLSQPARASNLGSEPHGTASGTGLTQAEEAWLQSLGQRISLQDANSGEVQAPADQIFEPVFEEDEETAAPQFIAGQHVMQDIHTRGETPQVPTLSINDTTLEGSDLMQQDQSGQQQTQHANPFNFTSQPMRANSDLAFGDGHLSGHGRAISTGSMPTAPVQNATLAGFAEWPAALQIDTSKRRANVPVEYSNVSQASMSSLSGAMPSQTHSDRDGSSNTLSVNAGLPPARQDSYEKLRKFLKLDVDMGFLSAKGSGVDSPTGTGMTAWRRRSNSDVGPRSPVTGPGAGASLFSVIPGGVTDKTPTAMTAGVDWATQTAKVRAARDIAAQVAAVPGTSSSSPQAPPVAVEFAPTLEPHMLQRSDDAAMAVDSQFSVSPAQGQQNSAGASASPSDHVSSAGGVGPVRRDMASRRESNARSPYHARAGSSGTASSPRPLPLAGLSAPIGGPALFAWQSKPSPVATSFGDNMSSLRRSQSARNPKRSHRRGAGSEDLSDMARGKIGEPGEYLARVTAPDGSLAPPSLNSSIGGPPSAAYYAGVGARGGAAGNAYRVSHDRHPSWESNTSNSSTGSVSMEPGGSPERPLGSFNPRLPGMPAVYTPGSLAAGVPGSSYHMMGFRGGNSPGGQLPSNASPSTAPPHPLGYSMYSQTALPQYSSLSTPPSAASANAYASSSSIPPPQLPPDGVMPPIQTVTTSATQAASASRRTNAAIHYCPVPGCNSSFTRKFNLNGHLRSHTGDKPFKCRECGKNFARHFDLSRHERLHSGIKAHTCESCGKNFARIDALRRHLRSDGGQGGCAARLGSVPASQAHSTNGNGNLSPGSPSTSEMTSISPSGSAIAGQGTQYTHPTIQIASNGNGRFVGHAM
ncbi:FOG: Zn-finger [Ceraceosorus bombacis]|uniref:FOG: Zn-finger n=2 Tax=Ceraceosorus TaxID=401624 RepID=A0A0P1BJK0_9BASI|nr:FOG: Zn-finger [Ceraceosorus bombacis]